MPRIARVVVPSVPYHITQRGNYRQDIFEDDFDREKYLEFFMMYKESFDLKLYAWCLMSNHVHFIVEPSTEKTLAQVFNATHVAYSKYFNKKRGVFGHLWQGRFYSCALDNDHLYEALRYVELNPLRARMAKKIESYNWTSAKMRITGKGKIPLDSIRNYLEIDDWQDYLMEGVNEDLINEIRSKTRTGRPLGNEKFTKKIEKLSGRSFALKKAGRPKKQKLKTK
ncbi:MAG: transposase [Flavobacteriales bacterium]